METYLKSFIYTIIVQWHTKIVGEILQSQKALIQSDKLD